MLSSVVAPRSVHTLSCHHYHLRNLCGKVCFSPVSQVRCLHPCGQRVRVRLPYSTPMLFSIACQIESVDVNTATGLSPYGASVPLANLLEGKKQEPQKLKSVDSTVWRKQMVTGMTHGLGVFISALGGGLS